MELKNGMKLKIEKAKRHDAGQVLDYLNLVGGESDNLLFGANEFTMSLEAEEEFIENLETSKVSALFVGKIDNEVVCIGSAMAPLRQRIAHQAEVAISVKKKYWGLGIGTHLMQAIIDFSRQNGTTEILHLGVRYGNDEAINLYRKMGFEEMGRYHNFFKINGQYYDEILMNLNL